MSTCRTCHADIVWAITENGNTIPLDKHADPDGNIEHTGRIGTTSQGTRAPIVRVTGNAQLPGLETPHHLRYLSHFATCPNANQHRRPRLAYDHHHDQPRPPDDEALHPSQQPPPPPPPRWRDTDPRIASPRFDHTTGTE